MKKNIISVCGCKEHRQHRLDLVQGKDKPYIRDHDIVLYRCNNCGETYTVQEMGGE